ncbi:glycoside hydrolase family 99-like domain-containing protein [Cryobacterium sp. N19]|uniref:glycoside hydrolase family 99-like domain-containing protein n=1 Tax=Cryobacterium sp. N19 TaxID=2048288 RepID=UPI002100BF0D|nr:glycoside hydrolase family 99-like domain-containing protein [Cryobacterium sp. N19]
MSRRLAPREAPAPRFEHPASHSSWVGRRSGKMRPAIPHSWAGSISTPESPSRIAVVLHVYYVDLVAELIEELAYIPVEFDLIITNASGHHVDLQTSHLPLLSHVSILDVPNRGRDILPLISLVNAGLLEPYDLILKIHTKKSAWREEHALLEGSGDAWRNGFVTGLLGSRANVENLLSEFAEDPSLGLLTTEGNIVGPEFWGGDQDLTAEILLRLQLILDPHSLRFAAGSMYWVRGFVLQGLWALDLDSEDFDDEQGQIDGTTAHAIERTIGILTKEAGYSLREHQDLSVTGSDEWAHYRREEQRTPRARVIPFYLPQFHTFPENDAWWGTGFTEWANVAAGKPVFLGHNQPFLPSDLGFYDLAHGDVRQKQFELAANAGIEGFMYYYYWFAGKKLMNMPVENLVASTDDAPFCIMWANENWTRRWDGGAENVLIAQDYDEVPATEFIHDVMPLLTDPRYIKIDGKPLVSVYRITQIPNFKEVLDYWRDAALAAGLPGLTLVTVDVGSNMDGFEGDIDASGLDAFLEFAPHNRPWRSQPRDGLAVDHRFEGGILSYAAMVRDSVAELLKPIDAARYPGVMVNFDNTARRQWQPHLWYGSNPYTFRRWLNAAVSAVADRDLGNRIVFLNAWNEWAEGTVLEPSQRFGRTYLLAVRDVLNR